MLEQLLKSGFDEMGIEYDARTLERYRIYFENLEETNKVMNLTAISGEEDVARLHFLDCAAVLKMEDFGGKKVIDVGTGAGFPGLAMKVADTHWCESVITGESIGQVASQTMQALVVTDIIADRPVFRPLIGMDKQEIIEISEKIGTFETSILPYEDCCTVFTPKHPRTRPTLEMIEEAEKALDIEELVNRCEIRHQRLRLYPKK